MFHHIDGFGALLHIPVEVRFQNFRFQNAKRANAPVPAVSAVVEQRAIGIDEADVVVFRAVRCSCPPPSVRKLRNVAAKKPVFVARDKPDADTIAAVIFQAVVGGQVNVEILKRKNEKNKKNSKQ